MTLHASLVLFWFVKKVILWPWLLTLDRHHEALVNGRSDFSIAGGIVFCSMVLFARVIYFLRTPADARTARIAKVFFGILWACVAGILVNMAGFFGYIDPNANWLVQLLSSGQVLATGDLLLGVSFTIFWVFFLCLSVFALWNGFCSRFLRTAIA